MTASPVPGHQPRVGAHSLDLTTLHAELGESSRGSSIRGDHRFWSRIRKLPTIGLSMNLRPINQRVKLGYYLITTTIQEAALSFQPCKVIVDGFQTASTRIRQTSISLMRQGIHLRSRVVLIYVQYFPCLPFATPRTRSSLLPSSMLAIYKHKVEYRSSPVSGSRLRSFAALLITLTNLADV